MRLISRGAPPPFVVPYCGLCGLPAERMAVMGGTALHERLVTAEVASAYYVEIEAQCCGKTQGKRVSIDEIMQIKRTNAKLFLVTKKGRYQGIGELVRAPMSRP